MLGKLNVTRMSRLNPLKFFWRSPDVIFNLDVGSHGVRPVCQSLHSGIKEWYKIQATAIIAI